MKIKSFSGFPDFLELFNILLCKVFRQLCKFLALWRGITIRAEILNRLALKFLWNRGKPQPASQPIPLYFPALTFM